MFVDLHAHTRGISTCCRIYAEDVIKTAVDNGFDGLAIANHYASSYFSDETYGEWIEKYITEWNLCQSLGEENGIKIFKAVEVTADYDPKIHLLIYGADEGFLRKNPRLNEKSLKELFALCESNGCALVQAHPFRGGATIQNTDFLHGLEINCHPKYGNSFSKEILTAAKEKQLAVTVGCDYHADTHRTKGGVVLPESVNTDRDLADYILNSVEFNLQIEEPANGEIYKTLYLR